ncbi:uncharacterized protein A4U43_C07F22860 [Asparagus officinalis]|uniref:ribonuclease H n=1 Tax=Asparagus officinalis TaxID=4686 RepID=A0A5P1EEB2_ASPOF|nr:uncharacterized protein A4U43_C07F22860 [Asparagus officinalis]
MIPRLRLAVLILKPCEHRRSNFAMKMKPWRKLLLKKGCRLLISVLLISVKKLSMARKSFYVVKRGRRCGIFDNWEECKSQVDKFPNASFKGYATYEEALIEWEKHTLARDPASSSRHVQTSEYAQEERYPVRHNLDEDKEKLRETSIFSSYDFVLGGGLMEEEKWGSRCSARARRKIGGEAAFVVGGVGELDGGGKSADSTRS